MGKYAVSAAAAWSLIAELLEDERIEFAAELALVDAVFPKLLKYPLPRLINSWETLISRLFRLRGKCG